VELLVSHAASPGDIETFGETDQQQMVYSAIHPYAMKATTVTIILQADNHPSMELVLQTSLTVDH